MPAALAGSAGKGTVEHGRTPVIFSFPLKDKVVDPDEASLFKVLESEYAAKYLEQLGANPTQLAQDIVRKTLPLTVDCLQVKLKAAGHKENEVLVMPPPYQVEILPIQEADPQDVVRLGFVGNLGDSADGTVENLQDLLWDQPLVSKSFRDVASKFLNKSARASTNHSKSAAGGLTCSQGLSTSTSELHQSVVKPRSGRVGIFCNLSHIQKELSRPFQVTTAVVKRFQLHFGQSMTEWYNALPRAAKGGHGQLKEQDIQHTTEELISEEIVTLAVTAITFLYYEFVVSSPAFPSDQLTTVLSKRTSLATQKSSRLHNGLHGYRSSFYSNLDTAPVSAGSSRTVSIAASQMQDVGSLAASITLQAEDQRSGLFSIVQLWANRSRMYSQSKWATNFARPAVILSLRALVDKVFSDAFPIWMTSAHGTAQLQDIDAQLLQWFDPHGFNSSISLLQSLPTAGHERTGHRHSQPAKSVHKHKRQHFNGTTSLVRAFLCEPKTAACRRLQHNSSVIKQQNLHMASELSQQQKGVMMKTAENLLLHSH